jgi:hypothetical protein
MHIGEALAAVDDEQAAATVTNQPQVFSSTTFRVQRGSQEARDRDAQGDFGKLKQDRGDAERVHGLGNSEGTFAVATLYRTVVYCWAA